MVIVIFSVRVFFEKSRQFSLLLLVFAIIANLAASHDTHYTAPTVRLKLYDPHYTIHAKRSAPPTCTTFSRTACNIDAIESHPRSIQQRRDAPRTLCNSNFYRVINLSGAIQRRVKPADLRENRETRGRRSVNRGKSRVKC